MANGVTIKEQPVQKLFGPGEWDALPPRHKIFVAEYLNDFNASRAAKVAGFKNPGIEGHRLLTAHKIGQAMEFAINSRTARTLIRADDVLKRWFLQATADPSELVETKVECCRHCWGIEHRYQWNEHEFKFACEAYEAEREEAEASGRQFRKKPPDESGGFGWKPGRKPHPECPMCDGRGLERVVIKPTDELSPQAKMLLAGYKQGKHGIEVLMHDQSKALEMVARHLGMLQPDNPTAVINNTINNANVQQNTIKKITRRIVDPKAMDEGPVIEGEVEGE